MRRGPRSAPAGRLLRRLVSENLPRLVEAAKVQARTVPGFVLGELLAGLDRASSRGPPVVETQAA